jgi:hypothetical protein
MNSEPISKDQHNALVAPANAGQPSLPPPDKITAMRMRKMAVLPDGRLFDLHGLRIVYAVEGKCGEEWRVLKHKQQVCVFDKPKHAASFISGRERPK